MHAHGLAAHVAPVRHHCYAAHRAGSSQHAAATHRRSIVVLLTIAEQKENCDLINLRHISPSPCAIYMAISSRIIHQTC